MERIASSVTVNQVKEVDKQGLIHTKKKLGRCPDQRYCSRSRRKFYNNPFSVAKNPDTFMNYYPQLLKDYSLQLIL